MTKGQRPAGLLAIAIIAIALGVLGACGGVVGVVGSIAQDQMVETQRSLLEGSGAPAAQVEAQMQMQESIQEVTERWLPVSIGLQILNVLVSLLLLGSGVQLLRQARSAPLMFTAAAGGNAFVDLGAGILGIVMQKQMQGAMEEMMAITASQPGQPPGMDRMTEGIMQASGWVGVCFGVGWVLLKLAYYVTGVIYLRRPAVRALFDPSAQQPGYQPPGGPPPGSPPPGQQPPMGPPPGGMPPAA